MSKQDIRWEQRFSNYNKALLQLEQAVKLSTQRGLSDLERQGLIQAFEFTHELAWNVMKDYFEYQGVTTRIIGSNDATRLAFKNGLLGDSETEGKDWMNMIESRNKTSHTYNEEIAEDISENVIHRYYPLFKTFQTTMESLRSSQQEDLFS